MNIYVHIPFCRRKCIYCDFYSVGERLADWPAFVDAILAEASQRIEEEEKFTISPAVCQWPSTIYIGGGTPSLIPEKEFGRLAGGLLNYFDTPPLEFTIEVNPDDVTDAKAQAWRNAGVNRVSMGVQSLVDSELATIGRRHDSARARDAYKILRRYFDNISLDLMFGLPGQTPESLQHTLDAFIEMGPEHVSAYSLMYEEATALTRMRDAGKIAEASDADSCGMFSLICSSLAEAGYERYEISNYSRPGRESIHNSLYWQGVPYIGLGPGAHSYDGNRCRRSNLPDFRSYMARGAEASIETLTDEELREEMLMTRLRTARGLSLVEYGGRFGSAALAKLRSDAKEWIADDKLILDEQNGMLRLSEAGVMISDEIIIALL